MLELDGRDGWIHIRKSIKKKRVARLNVWSFLILIALNINFREKNLGLKKYGKI